MENKISQNTKFNEFCIMKKNIFVKNKNGLSAIVATVILILLVMVTMGIVWVSVSNIIREKTEGAQSCFDVGFSEKITFNNDYTCYDSANNETQFSISVGDIDVEKVVVSISAEGSSKSFVITTQSGVVTDLLAYPERGTAIVLPGKNSGLTYIATGIRSPPEWIKIAPYAGEKQCEVTDTVYSLEDCSLFE